MKYLRLTLTMLVATLPMLWIENYTVTNSIFWTVYVSFFIGSILGYIEGMLDNNE